MKTIDHQTLSQLHCFLLPAKIEFCHRNFFSHHERVYDFWHSIIHTALCEEKNFDVANVLSSEQFLENDEAVVLFNHDQPIGLFMFRWINTAFKINRHLSALTKRFPSDLLDALNNDKHSHIMLMGHLAVHPDWRKSNTGFNISDMLMYFAVTRFLESKATVLLTTTRNNRRTNELCYRQGGKKAANNGKVFGVDSDIVLFHRDDISPMQDRELQCITQELWQQKKITWIDIPLAFLENEVHILSV